VCCHNFKNLILHLWQNAPKNVIAIKITFMKFLGLTGNKFVAIISQGAFSSQRQACIFHTSVTLWAFCYPYTSLFYVRSTMPSSNVKAQNINFKNP
jgi:hypothetical protein